MRRQRNAALVVAAVAFSGHVAVASSDMGDSNGRQDLVTASSRFFDVSDMSDEKVSFCFCKEDVLVAVLQLSCYFVVFY